MIDKKRFDEYVENLEIVIAEEIKRFKLLVNFKNPCDHCARTWQGAINPDHPDPCNFCSNTFDMFYPIEEDKE